MLTKAYPFTRSVDTIEERTGLRFPDPYRWLEENTDEVKRWQNEQNQLAMDHVRRWPHFEALRSRVDHFHRGRASGIARQVAGRSFRVSTEGATSGCVTVSEALTDESRILFDPRQENPNSPPVISWFALSPDGHTLALGVCADGSENNTIRLIDVATGEHLPDVPTHVLMDAWMGGAHWLADSSGFFYAALTGSTQDFTQAIFFYRLGEPPPTVPEPIPFPVDSCDYRAVTVSHCGRWAVASFGMMATRPVALRDLGDTRSTWRPFVTDVPGLLAGHIIGKRYVAVTDVAAPRGRVVAVSLDSPTPNDPDTWQELVPESDATIRTVVPVGDRLYVIELVDTYARVRFFSANGTELGVVPLPGKGALTEMPFPLMRLVAHRPSDEFVFGFSSLTESRGIYRHRPDENRFETLIAPEARIENAVVEDHWAVSPDGTRVPYHTIHLANLDRSGPHPALIFGYGAYGVSCDTHFPGAAAAFIEAGGVFVHTHLRGGGEFGLEWSRGGGMENKQQSYDDLYAIAEELVAKGMSTPQLLGVTGASSGGLMSAVAITQRPDLWTLAIPRVPILDLIGAIRTRYGEYVWKFELGDANDPNAVRRVAKLSPYQLVKDGVSYPAVYLDAGDTDPRCPPWHTRKFAARLQAAQTGENPIVLHVWPNAGHGWATSRDVELEQLTECFAFAMQILRLTPLTS